MWTLSLLWVLLLLLPLSVHAEELGELSANPFNPDFTANPFGAGSPFKSDGVSNSFSPFGSPFSNQSATNPLATDAPRLYVQQGNTAASSARTRTTPTRRVTPSVSGVPTAPAVPRIPTAAASELKDADLAAEPLHVIAWLTPPRSAPPPHTDSMGVRFTQTASPEVLAQKFALTDLPLFTSCYHIASSQSVAAIRIECGVKHSVLSYAA
jgi:hypothetical protein